jgi:hypothetical protein
MNTGAFKFILDRRRAQRIIGHENLLKYPFKVQGFKSSRSECSPPRHGFNRLAQ